MHNGNVLFGTRWSKSVILCRRALGPEPSIEEGGASSWVRTGQAWLKVRELEPAGSQRNNQEAGVAERMGPPWNCSEEELGSLLSWEAEMGG